MDIQVARTLTFRKLDMRHGDPPIKGPRTGWVFGCQSDKPTGDNVPHYPTLIAL